MLSASQSDFSESSLRVRSDDSDHLETSNFSVVSSDGILLTQVTILSEDSSLAFTLYYLRDVEDNGEVGSPCSW